MRRILCLLSLLVFAMPALAEPTPRLVTMPSSLVRVIEPPELEITPGHTLALGVGLFTGAVLGSALIAGGPVAALIGGIAGLATGHWVWSRHGTALD